MSRLIFVFLFALPLCAFAQYPAPLPASGTLSKKQIARWMYDAGELTTTEYQSALTVAFLNAKSHLADKTAPHNIRAWLGYAAPSGWNSAVVVLYPSATGCSSLGSPGASVNIAWQGALGVYSYIYNLDYSDCFDPFSENQFTYTGYIRLGCNLYYVNGAICDPDNAAQVTSVCVIPGC